MICPRCGAEMDSSKRYCMKCGALNYDHPDNQKMKHYISKEEVDEANKEYYEATQGAKSNIIEIAGKTYVDEVNPREKKKRTFIDTGIFISIIFVVSIVFGIVGYFGLYFSISLSILISLIYFFICFFLLANISIYMKGGYSGFAPLIPFYNLYAYYDIALGNGWLFLLTFIPIFGVFYQLYANYKLGKVFGRSGWLTLLLPVFLVPLIAFSEMSVYKGKGKKYQKYVDKGKRRNTLLPGFIYSFIILLVFILCIESPLFEIVREGSLNRDIENVVLTVEKDINDGVYSCNNGSLLEDGIYYIPFDDATELSNVKFPVRSSMNGERFSGYIKVQVSQGKMNLNYVMSDGDDIYSDMTVNDTVLPSGVNTCEKVD